MGTGHFGEGSERGLSSQVAAVRKLGLQAPWIDKPSLGSYGAGGLQGN
jgi:hypothetical protein